MTLPVRQTENLRHGRQSVAHARYFVTCCARRPTCALTGIECAEAILETIGSMDRGGDLRLLCVTIMPDHAHLLFELGERLALDRVVAKLKARTSQPLRQASAAWQANFHEHLLRVEEPNKGYARYIFLNPYRKPLVPRKSTWPWWRVGMGVDFDFVALLEEGKYPPADWLAATHDELGLRAEDVGND